MIKIGLTGGIGSGKSTVSNYLKSKGFTVIDCDEMSRNMTGIGGKALPDILESFGSAVFFEDGSLNRQALADIVFNDKDKLDILQNITTQKVIEETKMLLTKFEENNEIVVFVDAPLLFECGLENINNENWVITCDYDVKIKRIMQRDGISKKQIEDRMKNQLDDSDKIKKANVVIDNSGSIDDLNIQIEHHLERLGI